MSVDAQQPAPATTTASVAPRTSACPPACPRPNHWNARRQPANPRAVGRPAQAVAQDHQQRQRHDDRRQARAASRAARSPGRRGRRRQSRRGPPVAEARRRARASPTRTAQTPAVAPTDTSTCPVRITIVMPTAIDLHDGVGDDDVAQVGGLEEGGGEQDEKREQARAARAARGARAARRSTGRRSCRRGASEGGRHHRSRRPPSRAANSATSRPARITRMRSLMPSTSSSSDEISRTPMPARREVADDAMDLGLGADVHALRRLVENEHVWRAARASGRARPSAGCRRRAAAPASRATRSSPPARRPGACAVARSAARSSTPCREIALSDASVRFDRDRQVEHDAVTAAVFGQVGDAGGNRLGWRARIVPPCRRRARARGRVCASPNSTRASSVRPAPTRPARPTISPRRTVRLMSLHAGLCATSGPRRRAPDRRSRSRAWEISRRPRGRPSA